MPDPKPARKGPSAEELLRRWEADKKRSLAFLPLAEEYRRQDFIDAALSVLREGLKVHPNSQPARVALARCLMAKSQHAEAQAELERVRAKAPDNLLAGRLLAEALEARGEKGRALDVAKSLVPFGPDDPEIQELVDRLDADVTGRARATAPARTEGDTSEFHTGEFDAGAASSRAPVMAVLGDVEEATGDDLAAAAAIAAEMGTSGAVAKASPPPAALAVEAPAAPPSPLASAPPLGDLLGQGAAAVVRDVEDEFTSLTLAELYEAQDASAEALAIYERIELTRPGDPKLRQSIDRCRRKLSGAPTEVPAPAQPARRPRWAPVRPSAAPAEGASSEPAPPAAPGASAGSFAEEPAAPQAILRGAASEAAVAARAGRGAFLPPAQGLAPAALVALRGELARWLEAARAVRQ